MKICHRFIVLISPLIFYFNLSSSAQTVEKDLQKMVGKNGALHQLKPKTLVPDSRICFDKRFWFSTNLSGRNMKGCFYVNTSEGYVGINLNTNDRDCNISIDDKKLSFSIISKTGQSYIYTNDSKGNHCYMSPNVKTPAPPEVFAKRHGRTTGERRRFTEFSLPTWAYYNSMEGNTAAAMYKYMYGANYPNDGYIKNYLGAHGVGFFLFADETFICLSQEKADKYTTVDKIENVNFCFDASSFKDIKGDIVTIEAELIKDEKKQAESKQQDISKSTAYCRDFEQRILDHKNIMLQKRERSNKLMAEHANTRSIANQKIIFESADPVNDVIKMRLQFQKEQCDAQYTKEKIATKDAERARAQRKIDCLQTKIEALTELEEQLKAIDANYTNNPGKAQGEKSKLYLTKIGTITRLGNCN